MDKIEKWFFDWGREHLVEMFLLFVGWLMVKAGIYFLNEFLKTAVTRVCGWERVYEEV